LRRQTAHDFSPGWKIQPAQDGAEHESHEKVDTGPQQTGNTWT
jgi:hypothetical protein